MNPIRHMRPAVLLCLGSLLVLGGCTSAPEASAPALAAELMKNAEAQQLRLFLEGQGYAMQLAEAQDVVGEERSLLGVPFTRGSERAHILSMRNDPQGKPSQVIAVIPTVESREPLAAYDSYGVVNDQVMPLRRPEAEEAPYCDLACQSVGTWICFVNPGWWSYGFQNANECIISVSKTCGC